MTTKVSNTQWFLLGQNKSLCFTVWHRGGVAWVPNYVVDCMYIPSVWDVGYAEQPTESLFWSPLATQQNASENQTVISK